MTAKIFIDITRARSLRASGLSIECVADEVGCSKAYLCGVFKREGDPLPGGAMPLLRKFDHQRARQMRRDGATLDQIADAMGVSRTPVWNMLRRAGMVEGRA